MTNYELKYRYRPQGADEIYAKRMAENAYRKQRSEAERAQKEQMRLAEQQYLYDQQQRAEIAKQEAQQKAEEEKNRGGFLGGLGYVGEKVGLGALRTVEGIVDYVGGSVAKLFGQDAAAEDMMKNDWVNYNHADEWYNPGQGWQFAGDVTTGIGQMLPSIAVAAIPGVGPAVSTALGSATFMTGAAGQSLSDVVKDTGEFGGKEWLYGTGSGLLEGAVEYASGGLGGTKMGTVLGKKVAKSTAGKLGATFVGEGLEEVASDLIDPALRRVTGVDPDAQVNWQQLPNTFLVGGTVGAALGGMNRLAQAHKAGGFNNLNAAENAQTIREANEKGDRLQTKGKLDARWREILGEQKAETAERLSTQLQKMDEGSRSKLLADYKLDYLFDADGRLKAAPKKTQYNPEAVSYSLQDRVGLPEGDSRRLAYEPTREALSEAQKAVIANTEQMTKGKIKAVIAEDVRTRDGQKANGVYRDGVLYIDKSADALTVETVHEITHSLEGTEAYIDYANFVLGEIEKSPALQEKYGDYLERFFATEQAYEGQIREQGYNADEARYLIQTEMVSQYTADMFQDEQFIRRLAQSNRNVAVRMWNWIRDKIKALTAKGESRETVAFLQKAERLYQKALSDSVGGVNIKDLGLGKETSSEEKAPERPDEVARDARMSIQTIDGKQIVVIDTDQDIFEGVQRSEYGKIVRQYMKAHFRGETIDGVKFNSKSEGEYTKSKYTEQQRKQQPKVYDAKMHAATELGNLVKTSRYLKHEVAKHPHTYNVNGYNRYATQFILDGKRFSGEMLVALSDSGGAFYDIVNIKENGSAYEDDPKKVETVSSDQSIAQSDASVNSLRQNREKDSDERYSITVKDREYLKSIESGDMETAQRMVEEAAKEAGYTIKAYHGTTAKRFNEFAANSYFSPEYKYAEQYSHVLQADGTNEPKVYAVYLKPGNLKEVPFSTVRPTAYAILDRAKRDTILRRNPLLPSGTPEYIVKNSSQIKSADPITYDDKGNIIPLSERFNMKEKDIRYSLPVKDNKKPDGTRILTEIPVSEQTRKEKARDLWTNFQVHFSDEQAGVVKAGKKLGVADIETKTHFARAAYNAANTMLDEYQFDRSGRKVGDGFKKIWDPVYEKGDEYRLSFYEYLMQHQNIDRLAQGKELLANTSPEDSRKAIADLEKAHPEFKSIARKVWKYNDNLLQLRVDMGLVSQKSAEQMREMYPHYVPTFRDTKGAPGVGGLSGKYNLAVKTTIKTAKGSTLDILPPDVLTARQTMEVMRAGRVNELIGSLFDAAIAKNDFSELSVVERSKPRQSEQGDELYDLLNTDYSVKDNQNNQVSFLRDGERVTLAVSPGLFAGIDAYSPNTEYRDALIEMLSKANSGFKKLVTSANPFFLVRNFFRDLQEALFYSKHGTRRFLSAMGKAYRQIVTNGELWQRYKALGGLSSGLFDYDTGIKRATGLRAKADAVIGKLEWANMLIEQAPRMAEFMLSIENGATAEQALLDSAEVTTNFSRGGKTAKMLNRTVMPFLNPSIQGWSKLLRTVFGKKAAGEWIKLILKALILGVGVSALNDLLMGDDDDYAALSMRDKENYYLLKIGDTFLKLPKGRVLSVFGSLYLRGKESAQGNANAWDGYLSSVASQVSPVDNMTRTIFSPFADAATNTTWYGGTIEGRKFDNVAPKDRYDESTSSIAIALGKILNYSPKKIHYVIDQYSGIIGDVILPATTKRAERGIFQSNFTIDPALNNRWSNDFYTALDEANYAKSGGDLNSAYVVRYLNSVAGEVSDMYAQKQQIERSDRPRGDKTTESKAVQLLINETQKKAVEGVKALRAAIGKQNPGQAIAKLQKLKEYQALDGIGQEKAIQRLNDYHYAVAMNGAFGTEVDEKYRLYSLFDESVFACLTVIAGLEGEKDKDGNTVAGSRKQKVFAYINALPLSAAQKYILISLAGYKNAKGETQVRSLIRSKVRDVKETEALLKASGY